jgi:hypothetical protein
MRGSRFPDGGVFDKYSRYFELTVTDAKPDPDQMRVLAGYVIAVRVSLNDA